ncbi:hypothetical protein [uncultured Psychrobacter sp.]|uniref:hypothetical protein n=1 Tax=uncultured Psychrobacter sp. TaxID=259303 RepID=UPI0030D77FC9
MSSGKIDSIKEYLYTFDYMFLIALSALVVFSYLIISDHFVVEDDLQSDRFNCLNVYFDGPVPHSNPMPVSITTLYDNEAGLFSRNEGIYKIIRDNATFDYDESAIESVRILPNDCSSKTT